MQTAPAATTAGFAIVVADPKFESEMEHATAPDAEFRTAVKIWAAATVLIAVPGATTSRVGNTVTVVVPETPVESTALTVAVPAMASDVNTPAAVIVPISVASKE